MNVKTASQGLRSRVQQVWLALLMLVVLFTSVAPAHAAGSSVGFVNTSVICQVKQYRFSPGFVSTYNGQWVYYRLWVLNNTTKVWGATAWQYIQAYTDGTSPAIYQAAPTGQIISIKTEAYFYNNITKAWDYAGIKYANHWQLSAFGSPLTACKIY